ncbi:MAG: DUF1592 domain-containing protein, partial [Lentisphaeraceae bacterium]|nr:DUF1592 domain-containing protein [Lentisphaeraceae bacterium]
TQKGDVQLDSLDADIVKGKDGEHWHAALDAINSADMPPPKKKRQPSDAERRKIVEWITANIKLAGKLNKGKVQSVVRRLTREQYNNSLNDLLGINLYVTNLLPPESPSKMGFLNDSALQHSSSLLLETYQEIARKAVRLAIGPAEKPPVFRYRVDFGKNISKAKNTQKGGYQSVALSGHDFMPYALGKNGTTLKSSDKTETGKQVADVLKSISVGLRGSNKARFFSKDNALTLYAGYPQRNKAPESWRPPNPNAKLLIQREFPASGKFRYTVNAANSLPDRLPKYFISSTWGKNKSPSLISLSKGRLQKPSRAIVIPASSFKNLKDAKIDAKTVKAQKEKKYKGEFTVNFNLPKTAYYQLDLVYRKLPQNEKQLTLQVYSQNFKKSFNYKIPQTQNKLEITSLLNGNFKKGQGQLIFKNQLPAITHLVFTPLEGEALAQIKGPQDKRLAQRLEAINAYEDAPAVLRAFLGSRGDDGENYKYIENIQTVTGKPGQSKEYVFEGRLENFPLPALNIGKNIITGPGGQGGDISAIMVLGVYNHHLAPKKGGFGPVLDINSMTFEAPYYKSWPSKDYLKIFRTAKPKKDLESTRKVISRFINRAFRKKVEQTYVDRYVNFWQKIKGNYPRYEDGVAEVLIGILCSPEFLYMAEPPKSTDAKHVDEFQLANRLSYLLWNNSPDFTLLKAANRGNLSSQLDLHSERLLKHKNSEGFIKAFTSQWLAMERFESIEIADKNAFTPDIKEYMREETYSFLKHVLDKNLSLKNFIDSDFVMLNEHLASYYKIKGVKGHKFRPVKVARTLNRGGLLSQGSFLAGHSDGQHGHPIKRGVWLMKKILATEPPPPPANVPDFDESIPGLSKMSVKKKLELHSKKSSCKDCHAKIDPWGIAFEQYNALGRFNNRADAQSTLPDGSKINGIADLKKYLETQKFEQVTLSVVKHLLTYALGRELSYLDEAEVQEIVKVSLKKEHGFRDILKSIITHDIFRRL